MDKLTIRDFDPAGKRVLLRVDFNVPIEDGKVKDDSRIRAALPTIRYLLEHNASVILMSHLGRPKGKVIESARLRPVAARLSALIRRPVPVTGDALGLGTRDAVGRLKPGQLLMLENLRFHAEEEANDPEYAAALAGYGEVYVNDAFGTAHRAHASTVGVARLLPAYAGLLMEAELKALSRLLEAPERPFAAVIGGAKVSGKLAVLESLLAKVDALVIGGGMANTFLAAQGHTVGKSLLERDLVPEAERIIALAEKRGVQLLLPTDIVVAKEVTRGAEHKIVPVHKIPNSWSAVDIGPTSTQAFLDALEQAQTVFWNGPLGVFEVPTFGDGTRAMARFLADRAEQGATVVVGGGDSVAAVEELGLTDKMTHVSTGGGASLEFLEGRELPGVGVLLDADGGQNADQPTGSRKGAAVGAGSRVTRA
jgi:phosphoglycerate kinase